MRTKRTLTTLVVFAALACSGAASAASRKPTVAASPRLQTLQRVLAERMLWLAGLTPLPEPEAPMSSHGISDGPDPIGPQNDAPPPADENGGGTPTGPRGGSGSEGGRHGETGNATTLGVSRR